MCNNCNCNDCQAPKRGYNGWSNYETWAASLWIDNDYGAYKYWQDRTQEVYEESEATEYLTKTQVAANTLSSELEEFLQESNPLAGACNVYSDLLSAAIGEVDVYEIVNHWLYDLEQE